MKLYLVGLLDEQSYKAVENLQVKISNKYKLYDKLPKLHITLEVIDYCKIEDLHQVLNPLLSDVEKFDVMASGAICFEPPFKSVNLKIQNKGTIHDLVYKINYELKNKGFNVRENIDDWDLHISLANCYFSKRQWSQAEYTSACNLAKYYNFTDTLKIHKIQLWKPINDENEMLLKEYNLK